MNMIDHNIIDMSTLDCPFGCGERLVVSDDGAANCPTDGGWYGGECEGCAADFKDADAFVDTAWAIVAYEKRYLRLWEKEIDTHTKLLRQAEKTVTRSTKLANRISNQHG